MLIEETEIGEVHHDLVSCLSTNSLICSGFLAVLSIVDSDLMIDISPVYEPCCRAPVAVLIKSEDYTPAPGKFNSVVGTCLMVILIAVKQQNSRCFIALCSRDGRIQLVFEISDICINPSLRHINPAVTCLNLIGSNQTGENDKKQNTE